VSLISLLADAGAGGAPVLAVKSSDAALSSIWQQGSERPRSTICYVEADMDFGAINKNAIAMLAEGSGYLASGRNEGRR
jgi:hypothetical protein